MSRTLQIKVKEKGRKEDSAYKNEISLSDPSLIALVLTDLETMFGAPIKKACMIVLKKEKTFPF